MAAGIGRLFVDGEVDQVDEGLEQFFQLADQQTVGQRDRRLRGERFGELWSAEAKALTSRVTGSCALISCGTPMISPS